MALNPISLLPHVDLAASQIKCGYEKQAIRTLESIVKDLKDFVNETTQKNKEPEE